MDMDDDKAFWACSICGMTTYGFGNNPQPVREDVEDRCCDLCNSTVVIPARLEQLARMRDKV